MAKKPGREVVYRGKAHRALSGRRGRVIVNRRGVLRILFYGLPSGEPSVWEVSADDVAAIDAADAPASEAVPDTSSSDGRDRK